MKDHKVLIVSSVYTMKSGLAWSLVGLASEYKKKGLDFCVLLPKHGGLEDNLRKNDIPCKILPYYKCGWYTSDKKQSIIAKCKNIAKRIINHVSLNKIVRIIKNEKFTLVHINALTDDIGARAAMKANIKYVWHIREFMEEDLGIRFCNPEKAHREMNSAACMIAISEEVKKKFQPFVDKEIKVVYNGIDVQRFYKEREIFNSDHITICMVGRILPQKGQMHLVEAVVMLWEKGIRNIKVQFIGTVRDKAYVEQMKHKIEVSNLNDHFEFIEFTQQVEDYYQKSDIVCVCSAKEAFGRVTVEGMASGALVVGADSGGTLELIQEGATGYFYHGDPESLAEVLQNIIEHREEAGRVAKAGQKWAAEHFTAQNNAEGVLSVYNEI